METRQFEKDLKDLARAGTAEFTIGVTDLTVDQTQEYSNAPGNDFQPVFDTQSFADCP